MVWICEENLVKNISEFYELFPRKRKFSMWSLVCIFEENLVKNIFEFALLFVRKSNHGLVKLYFWTIVKFHMLCSQVGSRKIFSGSFNCNFHLSNHIFNCLITYIIKLKCSVHATFFISTFIELLNFSKMSSRLLSMFIRLPTASL